MWVPNGGTLVVWPRANGVDGAGATTKHWMCQVAMYSSGNPQRLHVMTDDDAMWVMFDQTNVGGYYNVFFFGPYTARTGVTPTTNFNLAMYEGYSKSGTAASWTTGAGTTSGTTADEGGIVIDAANGPKTFFWSSVQALDSALMQPNLVVGESDRLDVFLRVADASVPSQYGLVGKIDPSLLAFVSNVPTLTTNAAKTVAVFGSSNVSHTKYLVPWDGVTVPGSGPALAGVQFP